MVQYQARLLEDVQLDFLVVLETGPEQQGFVQLCRHVGVHTPPAADFAETRDSHYFAGVCAHGYIVRLGGGYAPGVVLVFKVRLREFARCVYGHHMW